MAFSPRTHTRRIGEIKQRLIPNRVKPKIVGEVGRSNLAQIVDINQVYQLARQMMPAQEIAIILGIPQRTFMELAHKSPRLGDALELGYADTRGNLRKTQLELALSGHPSMLMWLGKQYLGQSDKQQIETRTEVSVTVQRAQEALEGMPVDRLIAAQAALSGTVIDAQAVEVAQEAEIGAEADGAND